MYSAANPEDGDSMFLRNVGTYPRVHTASKPVRTSNLVYRFWIVVLENTAQCIHAGGYRRFGRTYYFHFQVSSLNFSSVTLLTLISTNIKPISPSFLTYRSTGLSLHSEAASAFCYTILPNTRLV
jgi:hypothetical protein